MVENQAKQSETPAKTNLLAVLDGKGNKFQDKSDSSRNFIADATTDPASYDFYGKSSTAKIQQSGGKAVEKKAYAGSVQKSW